MKKLLLLAAIAIIAMQSCDKSDDNKKVVVSERAKQALLSKYPGASDIVWRNSNNYVVATFTNNVIRATNTDRTSAWFDNNGGWYMTESDLRFENLPEAIKTAFNASLYASWRVDDVDKLDRNGAEIVYVIEVENQQTNSEVDLYYSIDGVLIKELVDFDNDDDKDDDYEDYIPSQQLPAIESYISKNHPNARILDVDKENGLIEVEILEGKVKRELTFSGDGVWRSTSTEVQAKNLPEAVKNAIKNSQYSSYEIDDVDLVQTATDEFYFVELENDKTDHTTYLKIKPDGTII